MIRSSRLRASAFLLALAVVSGAGAPLAQAQTSRFAYGEAAEDPVSFRGFPKTKTYRAYLPPVVDWSSRMPPVGDQGQQGSCVGWAVGYAARSYYNHAQAPRPAPVSPAYVFDNIRANPRDCEAGSVISRALDLLKRGAVTLDEYPYSDAVCLPARIQPNGGMGFKIEGWSTVDHTRVDDIKGQLAQGNPVIISLNVTTEVENLRGSQPVVSPYGSKVLGRHAITIVGYDEQKQAFKLINSWGEVWGDKGYGWVSFSDTRLFNAAYVMTPEKSVSPPLVPVTPPAPKPPAPNPAPTPAPTVDPKPDLEKLLEPLRAQLPAIATGKTCRPVQITAEQGTVRVSGSVATTAERASVLSLVSGAGAPVRDELTVKAWPGCELEETLATALAADQRPRLSTANGQSTFKAGDAIQFSVARPARTGYLYVFYISADGNVVTLAQPKAGARPDVAGGSVTFGDGSATGGRFRVTPPFGSETIVTISSSAPLFATPLKAGQIERELLTAVREAGNKLASTPGAWLGADLFTLTTSEN